MKSVFPWSVFIAFLILVVMSRLPAQQPPPTITDIAEGTLIYTTGLRSADSIRVISQGRSMQETFSDFVFDLTNGGWLGPLVPNNLVTNPYAAAMVFQGSVTASRFFGDGSGLVNTPPGPPYWQVQNQWSAGDTLGQNAWLTITNTTEVGAGISLGQVTPTAIGPAGALWLTRIQGPATYNDSILLGNNGNTVLNVPSVGGTMFFETAGSNILYAIDTNGKLNGDASMMTNFPPLSPAAVQAAFPNAVTNNYNGPPPLTFNATVNVAALGGTAIPLVINSPTAAGVIQLAINGVQVGFVNSSGFTFNNPTLSGVTKYTRNLVTPSSTVDYNVGNYQFGSSATAVTINNFANIDAANVSWTVYSVSNNTSTAWLFSWPLMCHTFNTNGTTVSGSLRQVSVPGLKLVKATFSNDTQGTNACVLVEF